MELQHKSERGLYNDEQSAGIPRDKTELRIFYDGSPGHFLFWSVSLLLIFQIKCQCTEVLNTYLSIHIY